MTAVPTSSCHCLRKSWKLEQKLLRFLTAPIPQPKYPIFTPVALPKPQTGKGLIVGFHWVSVATAFSEGTDPGWYYDVDDDHGMIVGLHEDDLVVLDEPAASDEHCSITPIQVPLAS